MSSRLTWTDPYGRAQRFPLGDAEEVIIGRDASCGVFIDSEDISRRHAIIQRSGDHYYLTDLGSMNGSLVNGVSATSPITLQSGDEIELAGTVHLEFESIEPPGLLLGLDLERHKALIAAIAGVVIAILIALGVALLRPGEADDPAMAAAVELAEKGIAAARKGDQFAARDFLRSAAGELYTAGYLDKVPRGDLQRAAMRLLQDRMSVSFDLWTFYDNVLHKPYVRRQQPVLPAGRCQLDRVPAHELEECLRTWIEYVLAEVRQDTDSIPDDFHKKVGARLRIEHDFIAGSLERGDELVPMFRRELEAAKMPPLLHYVALIESGYRNRATSTAAAAGVWQFMPATGRHYGLRVDQQVDERRDPEKATRAAAQYLRDLAFEFGGDALLLALAGYNRGENGVRRSLKKLDDPFSERSYWRLVERNLLPRETQDYVPRFIAAAVAGEGGLPSKQALEQAGY